MVQVSKPLHSCEYCGLEYWKTPAYIKHLIEFHNADLPKCSFCHKQFLSKNDLYEHLEDIHTADGGIKRHKCSVCSCSFKWLRDLKIHLALKHGPNAKPVLQCKHCGYEFYQRSTYTNHMLDKHWTKTVFQCDECLYKFRYKRLLVRHIQIKHATTNQWANCIFCPASYKWAHDLERHYQQKHRTLWLKMSKKDEGRNFKCSFDACFQSFESKEKFINHYFNEHKVNLPNEKDSQCSDILKTKQITNQNVGNKSYGLIIIPERFPQEIVDFECELRKVIEFRKLIDKRTLESRTDHEINHDGDDTASSITDAESEQTNNLQDLLQVNNSFGGSLITDSVENLNVNNNLVSEEEKLNFKSNDFVKVNESDRNIQKRSCSIVLKDLKIIITRLEDDKTLNEVNQVVQATNNTSKLNIHDLKASHLIRNNLLIDINVEKNIATFYLCRLCKLKFRVKKSLEHHMSEEHNFGSVLTSHKCKFCDAVFPFKYYLRQHLRGEHRDVLQRFRPSKSLERCAKCKLTFESILLYNIHMKIEHLQSNRTVLRCGSCNITFNTRRMLNKHRRLKHNQQKRLKNSVNLEPEHDNAPSYKCIACGVDYKNKFCLEEHMQLVHRSEENRQNVENDLVEINMKVEEMKLERKRISKAVKNVKTTKMRKNARQNKFALKIRPFGRNLKDLNSRFVLKNGVITSSKLEEDSLDGIAKIENFVQAPSNNETNSSFCCQKRKLRNTNIQETALKGLDIMNKPKQSTNIGIKRPPKIKSRKKVLPNLKNDIDSAKRNILIEEGSNQTTTEERKSVGQAMNLPETGEVILDMEIDYDGKYNSKSKAGTKRVSSKRKSIVKECEVSQKFSENITFGSNNSDFVLADNFESLYLNSHQNNSTDINIYSEENQRNGAIDDSITAKIIPDTLGIKCKTGEVFEIGEMLSIDTDHTVLKSDGQQSECKTLLKASIKHTEEGIKNYKCNLCNYVFNNKNSLETHIDCHTIVYRCSMCHSIFKRKGDLTRHVKSKHDVPIYTATPHELLKDIYTDHAYCTKVFEKRMLAENVPPSTDLMRKCLKCNFCDKYFASIEILQQHIKQFHKITNVTLSTCVTCYAVFNSDEDLHDHVKFIHNADDVCMKHVGETSQDGVQILSKRFNWKKALAHTYKSENICDKELK